MLKTFLSRKVAGYAVIVRRDLQRLKRRNVGIVNMRSVVGVGSLTLSFEFDTVDMGSDNSIGTINYYVSIRTKEII